MRVFTINVGNKPRLCELIKCGVDVQARDIQDLFGPIYAIVTGGYGYDGASSYSPLYMPVQLINANHIGKKTAKVFYVELSPLNDESDLTTYEKFKFIEVVDDSLDVDDIICVVNLYIDGPMPIAQTHFTGGILSYESNADCFFDEQHPEFNSFPGTIIAEGRITENKDSRWYHKDSKTDGVQTYVIKVQRDVIFRIYGFYPGTAKGSFDYLFKWDGVKLKYQSLHDFENEPIL